MNIFLSELLKIDMKNIKQSLPFLIFISLTLSAHSFPQGKAENDSSQLQPATGNLNLTEVDSTRIMDRRPLQATKRDNTVYFNVYSFGKNFTDFFLYFGPKEDFVHVITEGQEMDYPVMGRCDKGNVWECSMSVQAGRKGSPHSVSDELSKLMTHDDLYSSVRLSDETYSERENIEYFNFGFKAYIAITFGLPIDKTLLFPIFLAQSGMDFSNSWWLFPDTKDDPPEYSYTLKPYLPEGNKNIKHREYLLLTHNEEKVGFIAGVDSAKHNKFFIIL